MRIPPLLAGLLALSASAQAQVTTNDQSLNALKPAPRKAAPEAATAHRRTHATHTHAAPPKKPVAPAQKLPQVPPAPPANPVIAPPPLVMPAHPPPPPPPVPVLPDAQGAATMLPDGVRITFGPGKSDLNPATLAAIRAIAAAAIANPAITIGITAWAPGSADDPSTPRRLALDRALAARAVLINAGIASERIRTVAKGMLDIGQAPPDRAEVVKILPAPARQ
jgi:outer membrane protein OmpA-like peptidoglycan-associated protein